MSRTHQRTVSLGHILRILVAGVALAAAGARADTAKDFDLFVDPPTAFVFIKLPQGWKFVGKVSPQALANLPASVHTTLLPVEVAAQSNPGLAPQEATSSRPPVNQ